MTTITSSTTIGITLSSPSYVNPIVVDSGVTISNSGNAVYAASGYWAIQNAGTIEGSANSGTNGVYLKDGGSITNAASASIMGGNGVYIRSGGTVVNSGSIAGTWVLGGGVILSGGGSVTNTASASIYGGVFFMGGAGTVVNSGTIGGGVWETDGGSVTNASASIIEGIRGYAATTVVNSGSIGGVLLNSGGSVTNAASGWIKYGVGLINGNATVVNAGSIARWVYLDTSGSVTNAAGGSITGYVGVVLSSGGTVTNAGTITGSGGTAVEFVGAANNLLVVDPGAAFSGKASGSTSASNALELASGGSAGTLSGLGTSFANFGTVTVDSGASWELTGANTIAAGASLTDSGKLTDAGTLTNSGSISGGVTLGSGGVLANAAGGTITNLGIAVVYEGVTTTNGGIAAIYGVGDPGTVVNSGNIAGGRFGVALPGGGSVTNATSALIASEEEGVIIDGGFGTVVNGGSIEGTGAESAGVDLESGGSVANAPSALITGTDAGVYMRGAVGTLVNSGTIVGSDHFAAGVCLGAGGSATNAASASVTGGFNGIQIDETAGTVVNSGAITGVSFYGVFLLAGGAVTNAASASITGAHDGIGIIGIGTIVNSGSIGGSRFGVYLYRGGGTVTNAGTITGSGGTAISFAGTASDLLVVDPGAVFSGNVSGSTSASNALELAPGGSVGTLSGLGTSFANFGTVTVDSGASWELTGANTIAAGGTLVNSGTLTLSGAALTDAGSVVNNGALVFDIAGSTSLGGTLTGTGTLVVSGGGALDVVSAYTGAAQIDDTSTLEFTGTYVGAAAFSGAPTGPGGKLKLDVPSTGPITVVNPNDTVIARPGSGNWINAAVSYTLPANIDALFLYAGSQGTGNSDASGDALYALDANNAQTLTGNSANDTFVVDNASDVVVPKAGSHDVVYAAASFTLPTRVDTLILEGTATQGVGNSDAAGDGLFAANPGQVATLTGNSPNDTFVVYNSADVVVPKAGSHDVVYAAASYTLPTGVDVLILEAGTQAVGNSDAAGDALYAANAGIVQTLTGNSPNDTFVVYNSGDVVVPKAGSHDLVYSAVNYTLPTGVDQLILEAGTQAVGNSDAAGDTLYAANAGIAQTLTGHSHNDTFVVYNSGDVVVGQTASTDTVYAAASFTLPTNVDTLFLEGNASHGTGNNDAADTLYGNGGVASTLAAGSGADTLYVTGTAGTIMTGGAGHDTFAFPNVMGHDEVTNFGIAKDTLQFNATLFSNFTAAMNAASQSGANTVFTIDANDTVTLDNVTKTSLTAGNFHFT